MDSAQCDDGCAMGPTTSVASTMVPTTSHSSAISCSVSSASAMGPTTSWESTLNGPCPEESARLPTAFGGRPKSPIARPTVSVDGFMVPTVSDGTRLRPIQHGAPPALLMASGSSPNSETQPMDHAIVAMAMQSARLGNSSISSRAPAMAPVAYIGVAVSSMQAGSAVVVPFVAARRQPSPMKSAQSVVTPTHGGSATAPHAHGGSAMVPLGAGGRPASPIRVGGSAMMPVSIGGSAMVPMPSGELTTAPVVAGGPASVAMESVDRAAPVPADRFSASPCATQDSKNPLAADKIAEKPFVVTVVAPGAGVDVNSASYESLKKTSDHRSYGAIEVRFKGHKGAAYDVYPSSWPHGRAAPNLQSFAESLAEAGDLSSSSCLIFGSRGGQVVLPALWRAFGSSLPPALVINGGCAMSMLPDRGWWHWPDGAISFLLMGGKDYFRGKFSNEQHLRDAMGSVPKCNSTTAILYIDQMSHTPHGSLFMPLLGPLVHSLFEWKDSGCAPVSTFRHIINIARAGGFTGRLTFKEEPGDKWDETSFASFGVSRSVARVPARLRAFVARENQMLAPPPTTRPALHIEGTKSATGPAPAAATGTRSITSQNGYG